MKRTVLILAFCIMFSGLANAEIKFSEIDSTTIVGPGEIAEYNLKLENLDSDELNLQLKADPFVGLPSSYIEYVMINPNIITLKGHESAEINVKIKIKEDALTQKRYKTYIIASALNKELEEKYDLQAFVKEPDQKLSMYIKEYPESIEAGNDFIVTLRLENNVRESLSNINIYVSSELFEEHSTVQLFEGQERDVVYSLPVDSTTNQGEYTLNARAFYGEELQSSEEVKFSIGLNEEIETNVQEVNGFLYKQITVTKTNKGNYNAGASYDLKLGVIEDLFAKYSIRPTLEDENEMRWSFNLEPGESYVIEIKIDYRPITIAVVAIITFALLVWYWMSKSVIAKKEVFKLKQTTDGLSDFKILLHIKNNTNHKIKNLVIVEVLPKIINPLPKFGTLQPNNTERGEKGVRMTWRIPELIRGEERIISYDVEARMKVIGQFSLPQTMVKYDNPQGRTITLKSNRLSVSSGFLSELKKKG